MRATRLFLAVAVLILVLAGTGMVRGYRMATAVRAAPDGQCEILTRSGGVEQWVAKPADWCEGLPTPTPTPPPTATSVPTATSTPPTATTTPTPGLTLRQLVEDVTGATGYRYQARDNAGRSLDTLKVIDRPGGGYLGVYHVLAGAAFEVHLATSTDLLTWTQRVRLDAPASQPTLAALPDGGFLLVDEASPSHLRFTRYASLDALLAGAGEARFDAPRSLSTCAEGTPHVYSATASTIEVGFHYFRDCDVDRQARGTLTNFSQWAASVDTELNQPLEGTWNGNVGDRDGLTYGGVPYLLLETQRVKGDWSSWRVQLYDRQARAYTLLAPGTHRGSTAFANATMSAVTLPNGNRGVVVTYFLPSQGAATGEAGELIFYRDLDAPASPAPTVTVQPSPSTVPATSTVTAPPTGTVAPPPEGTVVLVGAGDIAGSGGGDEATARLLDGIPGTVYTLGDNAYDGGTASEFASYYEPTWGRHKARTRPSPGNHDYGTSGAAAYFAYFGANAGQQGRGYYSYDPSRYWHAIALNSNCGAIGGCGVGSPQYTWLQQDLTASAGRHVLAYWHHPRYSSGSTHGDNTSMDALWDLLYDHGADLVLAGHEHNYERFAPMDKAGARDDARGIRSFVVGTGGRSHYGFGAIRPNSEVRNGDTFGVLALTLRPDGYDWRFVPEAGKSFTDSGSATLGR